MSAESQDALLGNSMTGASPRQRLRHTTIGKPGKRRCHEVRHQADKTCYNGTRDATSHTSTEEVFSVGPPRGFLRRTSCGLKSVQSLVVDVSRAEWASELVERRHLVSSARELTAEASSKRLAWDGRQPARTWTRKQRNVRRREPLPSNASEDCEESSLVRQLVGSEPVSGSAGRQPWDSG
jgi:hypothetical protein